MRNALCLFDVCVTSLLLCSYPVLPSLDALQIAAAGQMPVLARQHCQSTEENSF